MGETRQNQASADAAAVEFTTRVLESAASSDAHHWVRVQGRGAGDAFICRRCSLRVQTWAQAAEREPNCPGHAQGVEQVVAANRLRPKDSRHNLLLILQGRGVSLFCDRCGSWCVGSTRKYNALSDDCAGKFKSQRGRENKARLDRRQHPDERNKEPLDWVGPFTLVDEAGAQDDA